VTAPKGRYVVHDLQTPSTVVFSCLHGWSYLIPNRQALTQWNYSRSSWSPCCIHSPEAHRLLDRGPRVDPQRGLLAPICHSDRAVSLPWAVRDPALVSACKRPVVDSA